VRPSSILSSASLMPELSRVNNARAIIGMTVDWQLLSVVFVVREDVVRIISARAAVEGEKKEYENQ
jgi:uncharacterized DUF497 family protein